MSKHFHSVLEDYLFGYGKVYDIAHLIESFDYLQGVESKISKARPNTAIDRDALSWGFTNALLEMDDYRADVFNLLET